jgi:hypothetical protein
MRFGYVKCPTSVLPAAAFSDWLNLAVAAAEAPAPGSGSADGTTPAAA